MHSSRRPRRSSGNNSNQKRRVIAREEDVTLDDLIRDKAIRPGDALCLELEHSKGGGEKTVSFREVGYVTADGWINDDHNNIHSALDQWAYAAVTRTKQLSVGQCGRLIKSCDLWKHIKVNDDTLDNIRKCYIEWVLSNKGNHQSNSIEKENEGDRKDEVNNNDGDDRKGVEVVVNDNNDNDDESNNNVDLNADTLPALQTPPGTPTKQTTINRGNDNDGKTPRDAKTPVTKRKEFTYSPCLDTAKKRPKLTAPDSDSSDDSISTENLDQLNDQLCHYERMLAAIKARENANTNIFNYISNNDNNINNNINNNNNNATQLSLQPLKSSSATVTSTIVILPTGLKPELSGYLRATAERLGGSVVSTFSDAVTHVVTETDDSGRALQRTLKYAQAVIAGKRIVSFPWVLESARRGAWAPEEPFDVIGDCFCDNRSGNGGCGGLFSGKRVYLSDAIPTAMARELGAVVVFGGGAVLDDLPAAGGLTTEEILHPSVVVVAPSSLDPVKANDLYLRSGRCPVSYKWIMDSVSGRALADTRDYEITHSDGNNKDRFEDEPSLAY